MLGLSTDGHPLAGGFHYRFCVIFHLSGGVIFRPTHPIPNIGGFIINPHHHARTECVYTNLYHTSTISAACMACHLTGSQISLQADWLWLCSLQVSVHIYTVTYRVTCRRVCTYYIVGHNRDTTWIHACLYIINIHINL